MTKPTLPASTPRRLLLLRLARPMAAMAMVLTVPLTASAMAAVESSTQAELNRFLTVFEEVKANYVEPVSDDKLIDGAISGMLAALDPHHLIFSIWATTQHYADFDVQVRAVLGPGHDPHAEAGRFLLDLYRRSLTPADPAPRIAADATSPLTKP